MNQTLEMITRTKEYLNYVEEHINNVGRAWRELQAKCKDMRFIYDDFHYNWIGSEVEGHDLSKLSEHEFVQYRRVFYPCSFEKKEKLSDAWEHHKKHNPHHWENWTEKDFYHPHEWEVHCVHMVIDWIAMGYNFGDTAQEYYESNKDKIKIPNYAVDFIYEIFSRLARGKK